jgi:methyl-accepting chemotaxis protein
MNSRTDDLPSSRPTGDPGQQIAEYLASLDEQLPRVSEVWCRHIANVRGQVESAIVGLTREFTEIILGLDALVATAEQLEADEQRFADVLARSQASERGDVVALLRGTALSLEREANRIRGSIDAALVHLQFQDRINQILGHVEANIHGLPASLASRQAEWLQGGRLWPVDLAHLLDELQSSYSTLEEHAAHPELGQPGSDYEIHYF